MPEISDVVTELRSIVSPSAVLTDDDILDAYSHDTWPLSTKQAGLGLHETRPDVVVRLASFDDAAAVFALASSRSIPVTIRALASSVTGQPLPVRGGIVLDVSAVPAHYSVNRTNMTVTATASFNGGELERLLEEEKLTLGHSPQSLHRSTVGGWVSTLATGQFSSKYGGIEDLLVGCTVILATGETVELTANPRAAMGPDLRQVFIGAEGTLGLVTSVTLKVFRHDLPTELEAFSMQDVQSGLDVLREQSILGLSPFLLRFYDTDEARHVLGDEEFSTPLLFIGVRGPQEMIDAELAILRRLIAERGGKSIGSAPVERWMANRFDFSSVENRLAEKGGFAETIEVAHNWDGIVPLYEDLHRALSPLAEDVYSHWSHVYPQGTSLYVILKGHAEDDPAAIAAIQTMWSTAMDVCLKHGAELSHHHGGGLARSPYSRASLGSAHIVLQKVKAALDPAGILNPGKLGL